MGMFPTGYTGIGYTGNAEVAPIASNRNAKRNSSRYDQVNQAFQNVLGRNAGDAEIEQWARDFIDTGRGIRAIEETLRGGSEYRNKGLSSSMPEFKSPAPTELEKGLAQYLTETRNKGVEGIFSGEFGQKLLNLLKGFLEPDREAMNVDLAFQKIAEEVINPAAKAKETAMLNRFGKQGIARGGLPADVMGRLYDQKGQSLQQALRDILLENENLKRNDIAKALQGFGIGEDFLKNILGQSNQLISTRGSLDSAGADRALREYLGKLDYNLGEQKLDFDKWYAEQKMAENESNRNDNIWGTLFKTIAPIALDTFFPGVGTALSIGSNVAQGRYPKALPTTSFYGGDNTSLFP